VLVLVSFALGMAALGLYGVLSFGVQQRRRELGVRAALGASPSMLLTMVLRGGVALAVVGIAIGFVLAIVLTGVLRTLLFEVSPTEPLTFAVVAGVAMLVAILASVVPAWSASKANAMDAIRLG
jgi:ABC-type antimicrobial peptide transport system permease subunit